LPIGSGKLLSFFASLGGSLFKAKSPEPWPFVPEGKAGGPLLLLGCSTEFLACSSFFFIWAWTSSSPAGDGDSGKSGLPGAFDFPKFPATGSPNGLFGSSVTVPVPPSC
jgi:hypothetical protein